MPVLDRKSASSRQHNGARPRGRSHSPGPPSSYCLVKSSRSQSPHSAYASSSPSLSKSKTREPSSERHETPESWNRFHSVAREITSPSRTELERQLRKERHECEALKCRHEELERKVELLTLKLGQSAPEESEAEHAEIAQASKFEAAIVPVGSFKHSLVHTGSCSAQASLVFEFEVAHIERDIFFDLVESKLQHGVDVSDIVSHLAVFDCQGDMVPQNMFCKGLVQCLPETFDSYPLRVICRQPNTRITTPEHRGLRLADLIKFFRQECGEITSEHALLPICTATKLARSCNRANQKYVDMNVEFKPDLYAVSSMLIRKLTEATRLSMVELLSDHDGGLQIEVFVSNYWGEDFGEFTQSCYRFAIQYVTSGGVTRRASIIPAENVLQRAEELALYVCAFCNNQWNHGAEMGMANLEESLVYKAMRSPSTVVVVMNLDQSANMLFRAWCGFEFCLALQLGKRVEISTRFGPLRRLSAHNTQIEVWSLHIFEILQDIDLGRAQASNKDDLRLIRTHLAMFNEEANGKIGAVALTFAFKSLISDQMLPLLAQSGCAVAVTRALESGANPNGTDHRHVRALTYAVGLHGVNSKTAQILRERGADRRAERKAALVVSLFDEEARTEALVTMSRLEREDPDIFNFHSPAYLAAREEFNRHIGTTHLVTLASPDPQIRLASLQRLSIENHLEAVPMIIKRLEDESAEVRKEVCDTLAKFGDACSMDAAQSKRLVRLLHDVDSEVRKSACRALTRVGNLAAKHAGEVTALLHDPDPDVADVAWQVLGKLGDVAIPHMAAIAKGLSDVRASVRMEALKTLLQLGPVAEHYADNFAELLMDESSDLRQEACNALSMFPKAATRYLQPLRDRIDDKCEGVREAAQNAVSSTLKFTRQDVMSKCAVHFIKDRCTPGSYPRVSQPDDGNSRNIQQVAVYGEVKSTKDLRSQVCNVLYSAPSPAFTPLPALPSAPSLAPNGIRRRPQSSKTVRQCRTPSFEPRRSPNWHAHVLQQMQIEKEPAEA